MLRFILLLGGTYTFIWAFVEPLNLDIISNNKAEWRWFLVGATVFITGFLYAVSCTKRTLQEFGLGVNETNLMNSFKSAGSPEISVAVDGYHGNVFNVNAGHDKDGMNYELKASAHKASTISFTYIPTTSLTFYLRVSMVSKDRSSQRLGWIRLEPNLSIPGCSEGQDEVAYPVDAKNHDKMLKTKVNIKDAVKCTYGREGWQYNKIIAIRLLGKGMVKNICLKG